MNLEQARAQLVERQLRPWGVNDAAVLALLREDRRENFTPPEWRALAYADIEIPLAPGAVMLTPLVEARALQALKVKKSDSALLIGAGSGHMAALLGALASRVCAVEISPTLAGLARDNLRRASIGNVDVVCGNAAGGWAQHAPYDVIMATGGLSPLADALREQLKPGGRLFAFVGATPVQQARLVVRGEHGYTANDLFLTDIEPLLDAPAPMPFDF